MLRRLLILLVGLMLVACSTALPLPAPSPISPTIVALAPTTTPPPTVVALAPTATVLPPTLAAPTPTPEPSDDSAAIVAAVREAAPRDAVALALAWGIISQTVTLPVQPLPELGEQTSFWVNDTTTNQYFAVTATLRVQSEHLLLYVAADVNASDANLQRAADTFEQRGWPLLSRWYDAAALPARPITVLNANIPGVGGYYAADNELPRILNPYSSEREIVFLNARAASIGSDGYVGVLIHETQHLLHRNALAHPATWFNEGASMLSEYRAGYGDDGLVTAFLVAPDLQLNGWADSANNALGHYGAAELFLRFLDDQTGALPLGDLARADTGDNLDVLTTRLQTRFPDLQTFSDVYATWAVANLVNDESLADGRYGYPSLPQTVQPQSANDDQTTVNQLGADYLEWSPEPNERRVVWQGDPTVPVIPAPVVAGEQVWWSGRGDARISTLSTAITVPASGASLRYRAWFAIEPDFDYAYLSVSTDDGQTWQPLQTPSSTAANPLGLNLGQGWTGEQTTWRNEQIDLAAWAGQAIQLRFWMINDEGYNAPGLALADLALDGLPNATWTGAGFVEIANQLPQQWELRGVVFPPNGAPQIVELPVVQNQVEWTIPAETRAVLVVVAATAATTEPGQYRYETTP